MTCHWGIDLSIWWLLCDWLDRFDQPMWDFVCNNGHAFMYGYVTRACSNHYVLGHACLSSYEYLRLPKPSDDSSVLFTVGCSWHPLTDLFVSDLPKPGFKTIMIGMLAALILLPGFAFSSLLQLSNTSPMRVLRKNVNPSPPSEIIVNLLIWIETSKIIVHTNILSSNRQRPIQNQSFLESVVSPRLLTDPFRSVSRS